MALPDHGPDHTCGTRSAACSARIVIRPKNAKPPDRIDTVFVKRCCRVTGLQRNFQCLTGGVMLVTR